MEVAATAVEIVTVGIDLERPRGASGVRLRDSVTVRIEFKPRESWVFDWVFTQSQSYQDDLLNHENGHYKLTALLGRDYFMALMQVKANTYPDARALQAALNQAQQPAAKAQATVRRYDDLTTNGTDSAQQTLWDGYFSRAFTQAAVPAQTAPDGSPVRIPLLTVLSQAGIVI